MKEFVMQLSKGLYSLYINVFSRTVSKKNEEQLVSYLLSFPNNNFQLIEGLNELPNVDELTVFYTKNCQEEVRKYRYLGIRTQAINHWSFFFKGLKILVNSQIILMDNYFAFLGSVRFSKQNKIYQIWHANGAIKTFGWEDKETLKRTKSDKKRFQKVYDSVNYYVTGSQEMNTVYQNSYHQSMHKMLEIGVSRTDFYFDVELKEKAMKKFREKFPESIGKKIVLYAPTYRDGKLTIVNWYEKLPIFPDDYFVICKFHPLLVNEKGRKPAAYNDTRGMNLNELLFSIDVLISDYSSIPFEYVLANPNGRVLFYCFDLVQYSQKVGIQDAFFEKNGFPIIQTKESLLKYLKENECKVDVFSTWNRWNDGKATERLLNHVSSHLIDYRN